jgi:hypothetical protein
LKFKVLCCAAAEPLSFRAVLAAEGYTPKVIPRKGFRLQPVASPRCCIDDRRPPWVLIRLVVPGVNRRSLGVAVHESRVTSVKESIERRSYLLDASVDQTEARNVAGYGPDDSVIGRAGDRARRSS